jgi:hypothetical protein
MHHLAIILVLFAAITASAQDLLTVPPLTQGERGAIIRIPVSGTITQSGTSQVGLSFPADVIRIRSVEGGEQFAYHCEQLLVNNVDVSSGSIGTMTVQCEDVSATTNGPLFEIVAEILRGPGTNGPVQATELVLNGTTIQNVTLVPGAVEAIGEPVLPRVTEGFTGNYPNPFAKSSTFVFQVAKPGTATLAVRSIQGRLVLDLGTVNVTAGENQYQFNPEGWELAQGPYMMQLVTERDQYVHPFMVVK